MLGERNEGLIQMTYLPEATEYGGDLQARAGKHYEDLALASGRPILYNAILVNDQHPDRFRGQLKWLESCAKRGIRVLGQSLALEQSFSFTFKDWNLSDGCRRGANALRAQSKIG